MVKLITPASSINRALDQIGDKWCLLIIQEVYWGITSFNEMLAATGVSKGVLSDRLKWLVSLDCLRKETQSESVQRPRYHLTKKSMDLYSTALAALNWERIYYSTPDLDAVKLVHTNCGKVFVPKMQCRTCDEVIDVRDTAYNAGPGAQQDHREKKVRRRSSIPISDVPNAHSLYKNLIDLVGDRWTSNLIALSFHGLKRFDEFHIELPVATNILAGRLKFLVEEAIFEQRAYQDRPIRYEYHLTEKGRNLFPWFLALLQWGDKWCDPTGAGRPVNVTHTSCNSLLTGEMKCSECDGLLKAHEVSYAFNGADKD